MASTFDSASPLKMKLPNNDAQIQKFEALRDAELAKGSNANTEKFLAIIEIINVFACLGLGAILRFNARERTHKANEQHEMLTESHRNWKAKSLQSIGGSIGIAGALFVASVAIGATLSGIPAAGVQTVINWATGILTAATQGFSSLGSAAQSGDQADINKYDHAVKNEHTERSDDQSTYQAVKGQEAETVRRKKEADQQKNAAWSAAAGASR